MSPELPSFLTEVKCLEESVRLYRLGGDFLKVVVSHRLEPITGKRVDIGLIDQYSLDRLTRLVSGGVCHINDLYGSVAKNDF